MASNEGNRSTLAERLRKTHAVWRVQAKADYVESMRTADLEGLGIFLHTIRRFTEGVEPRWLIRAKRLHDELGKYIYLVSQRDAMDLPPETMREAEQWIRAFVQGLPSQVEHDRLDAATLLIAVDVVVHCREPFREVLDMGQPPSEVVCFTYSCHDLEIAIRLAEHEDELECLLGRWTDATPRRPTKWQVVAKLWEHATGKRYSPDTWRRWDPRKKQILPKPKNL